MWSCDRLKNIRTMYLFFNYLLRLLMAFGIRRGGKPISVPNTVTAKVLKHNQGVSEQLLKDMSTGSLWKKRVSAKLCLCHYFFVSISSSLPFCLIFEVQKCVNALRPHKNNNLTTWKITDLKSISIPGEEAILDNCTNKIFCVPSASL